MLVQLAVQSAKPRERPYKPSDGDGLYLLIEPNGSKLWRFRYQFDRKEKMLSLGAFPEVSIAAARERKNEARKVLAQGIDPSKKRRDDRREAEIAAANTFGAIRTERDRGAAQSTMAKNRWLLEDLAAPLTNRPLTEITPREILDVLKKVEKTGRRAKPLTVCGARSAASTASPSRATRLRPIRPSLSGVRFFRRSPDTAPRSRRRKISACSWPASTITTGDRR